MTTPQQQGSTDDIDTAADDSCPQCGTSDLTARHCKAVCEQCGYTESCEDLFPE